MLKQTLAILTLTLTAGTALAQAEKAAQPTDKPAAPAAKATKLAIGDTAPMLEVEKFVKGDAITGFEKGKVYVVEFWATWCGPCKVSIPHITKLQKQYKDKGVTMVGVSVWEDRVKPYGDETLTKVNDFVKEFGDKMAYTVAYDGAAKKTDLAYMKASGSRGIPTAFIVNQEGKIAWIGHPMMMDPVLGMVVNGKWDIKESPKKLEAAQKKAGEIAQKAEDDAKGALADWKAFEKENGAFAESFGEIKLHVLMAAGEYADAYKILSAKADAAIAEKDFMALNEIAWSIVDPEAKVEKKDLDLAFKAASKAAEFSKNEDGAILDTLARVYFLKGDKAKAIETQKLAIAKAPEGLKEQLKDALKEYEGGDK